MKTKQLIIVLTLLLFNGLVCQSQNWRMVWSEEFDQPSLDLNTWNIEVNNFGGYNNELQYYTNRPENIRLEDGNLVIEARRENYINRNYTSARINSRGKKSFKYGKIEASIKLPYGNGMWPAFWMMGNTGSWPACGEIDIMEMVGGNKCWDCADNKTHGYMWYYDNGEKSHGTAAPPLASGRYADNYHLFSVEWDETSIKWFVDNKQFYSHNITSSAMTEFHQPFYLLLNLAIGGDWPGSPDHTTVFPQRMYVDYVRVYEKVNCTAPAQPSAINGSTNVTPGSSQTYTITPVSGATSYTWTLPSGWSGTSSSTSITTTAGSTGGTISVRANNSCGPSTASTLYVTVGGTPSANLALNKPVTVSSVETTGLEGSKAVDGNLNSRWASTYADNQWIYVDLGATYNINRVKITWEAAYARNYQIQYSTDANTWENLRNITNNTSLVLDHQGLNGTGRYVRIYASTRATIWGFSIYELEVYGTPVSNAFTLRIEAEDYSVMSGIQTEPCSEGGLNVGYFDAGDWLSYRIEIPRTGTYKVSYRVASIHNNRTLRMEKDAGTNLLGTVNIPNTGDWQNWQTISHNVSLPEGSYSIGLTTYTGGLNINWLEITDDLTSPAQASTEKSSSKELSFYPNPVENTLHLAEPLSEASSIQILDAYGTEIKNIKLPEGSTEVALEDLKQGAYLIRISGSGKTKAVRFFKQ